MNRLLLGTNRARRRLVLILSASMMVLAFALHGGSAFADGDETGPADGCAPSLAGEGFFSRFTDTYKSMLFDYWKDPTNYPAYMADSGKPLPTPEDQPPAYRGAPPTMDEPPFPYSTFPIGGTETIGYQGGYNSTYATPLMNTLWCGPYGKWIKDTDRKSVV